jgi:hypothetical protein
MTMIVKNIKQSTKIPKNAVPVDVTDNGITWRVNPQHNTWEHQSLSPGPNHVYLDLRSMATWERHMLQQMELLVPLETITHQTQQQLIIASDGSVQDHRASFGWIIATTGGLSAVAQRMVITHLHIEQKAMVFYQSFVSFISVKRNGDGKAVTQ